MEDVDLCRERTYVLVLAIVANQAVADDKDDDSDQDQRELLEAVHRLGSFDGFIITKNNKTHRGRMDNAKERVSKVDK